MKSMMNDTHPMVAAEIQKRMMALSGETRIKMGSNMFDAARQLVLASLPRTLTEDEVRTALFLRFYGAEFDGKTKQDIINDWTLAL
jgi:hypothetical protein